MDFCQYRIALRGKSNYQRGFVLLFREVRNFDYVHGRLILFNRLRRKEKAYRGKPFNETGRNS